MVAPPAKPMWEKLTATLDSYKIPYIVVLGNHDAEAGIPRSEIARLVTSGKFNLNAIDGEGELADMDFPVYFNGSVASHIFALDSHDYSPIKSVPGYAWFTPEQVDWLRLSRPLLSSTSLFANTLPSWRACILLLLE